MHRLLLKNRFLGSCIVGCGFIMISCILSCEINTDVFVMMDTYYEGNSFWSPSVDGIGTCAKMCMRMTKCESFNFDFSNRDCDLNSDLLENNLDLGKSKRRSVYSRIRDWPKQLDPECFHRPCKTDEICIPNKSTNFPKKEGKCIRVRGTKSALPEIFPTTPSDPDVTVGQDSASSRQGLCHKASAIMSKMTEASQLKSVVSTHTTQNPTAFTATTPETPGVCEFLKAPAHGNVTIHEGKANYSCEGCYILKGETTRTCLPNGEWEGTEPICTQSTFKNYTAGNRKYFFSTCELKWIAAKRECQSVGAELAEIESEAENNFLCDKIVLEPGASERFWWLGGRFVNEKGDYIWEASNTLINETGYTNWAHAELKYVKSKVVLSKTVGGCLWEARKQRFEHFFICEQVSDTEY